MNSWNKSIFSWVKKWKRTPSPTLVQTWFSWSCGRFTATFWKVRLTMLGRSWNVSFWWEEVELWQEELSRLINGTWNQWKLIITRYKPMWMGGEYKLSWTKIDKLVLKLKRSWTKMKIQQTVFFYFRGLGVSCFFWYV